MEGEPKLHPDQPEPGEIREINGKRRRWEPSGYTIREWYSHETKEKGPGPGWDFHLAILEKYGVQHTWELPDTPHGFWEVVKDDEGNI